MRLSPRSSTSTMDYTSNTSSFVSSDTDVHFGHKSTSSNQSPKSQSTADYETRLKLGFDYTDLCNRTDIKENIGQEGATNSAGNNLICKRYLKIPVVIY